MYVAEKLIRTKSNRQIWKISKFDRDIFHGYMLGLKLESTPSEVLR